mgnify:CR=1 FL=1|jgi:hypothetical protein|tara:strand:+ start:972 stop:1211 length:240 start_codon:yes stop_codon:yes gene_type:complete
MAPADGTLAAVTDPPTNPTTDGAPPVPVDVPDIDDAELDALEADLATIEVAMERVDTGDLEGYEAVVTRLDEGSSGTSD